MLKYIGSCSTFCYLDNNQYKHLPSVYELLAAGGSVRKLVFEDIKDCKDWIFGHCPYQAAAEKPELSCCFVPTTVLYILPQSLELIIETWGCADTELENFLSFQPKKTAILPFLAGSWQCSTPPELYVDTVEQIRNDIAAGEYYELNYCISYINTIRNLDTLELFDRLNKHNPSPFACYFGWDNQYILGASPERFLHRENLLLTTQPIKGTTARGSNAKEDEELSKDLRCSIKERAENVMIVDLSRSDLAKVCEVGSITVPKLFEIYRFPTVQHMVSTVVGKVKEAMGFSEIWPLIFPMGSMTGAPKLRVIEAIEQYEAEPRRLYSGSTFYIKPNGDFDSNVAIRSLIYTKSTAELSYHTGSAITYDSVAKEEWAELQLKAAAMRKVVADLQ